MVNFSSNYYYGSQRYPEVQGRALHFSARTARATHGMQALCAARARPQVPRLTPEHHAAIKLFEEIAASDEVPRCASSWRRLEELVEAPRAACFLVGP